MLVIAYTQGFEPSESNYTALVEVFTVSESVLSAVMWS